MSYNGLALVPPANTTFSTLNTSSLYTTSTVGNNMIMNFHCNNAGDNLCGSYVNAPSTPYMAIMCVACNPGDYANNNGTVTVVYGPGLYDGTKAVVSFITWNNGATLANNVYYFSNATTPTGLAGNRLASGYATGNVMWFAARDDGTNILFYTGTDGAEGVQPTNWTQIYSESRTTHLPSGPTKVGFFCDPNGTSGQYIYMTMLSFQVVSL